MPNSNNHTPKGWATGAGGFTSWINVKGYQNGWQNAKRVFRCISPGVWTEVWSNRPVVTTAVGTSSAFDRITANGAVDPNNFSATPRFYYKKNADSTYTADTELTALTGDSFQDVTSTITGLTENTQYNYYLLATNSAGTSDTPTVRNVTTPLDCRTVANGGTGWGSSTSSVGAGCGQCGQKTVTTVTYTKTGCVNSPYDVVSETTCTEDACGCKVASTNGWSEKKIRYREITCAGSCNQQTQYQEYIEKSGCTEHIVTDWTNTGGCDDGWYRLIPIYGFQYNIMYNYLGDGVDWFALFNSGGFYPSNNIYGGCGSAGYRLWYLYRCSYGYTDNSRNGQYEYPTGICVTS